MPTGSITNVAPPARPFSLSSTVKATQLGGKFQRIGNSPRSNPIGTPLANASGEYFKQCAGEGLRVARDVMAEVRDASGQKERHVAALNKSIQWATPGVDEHHGQFVLSRLTILGCLHAGISDLLKEDPNNATLVGLRGSVSHAIGEIGRLGGKGERPQSGGFRGGDKYSGPFSDALRDSKGCVLASLKKLGPAVLFDAIGRAVVAEPLLRSMEARNPQMYAALLKDGGSKLDVMQALSKTWSDKLQANISGLLDVGDYHHIEIAIMQALKTPDLVLQSQHGKPAPADNPRPPQAPPDIPQPILDKAGNGGVFYNYSPNTTEIHMDGFLKELFGQLKDLGGGFKAGELLGVFNLMNDQFAASRDMLIEHGMLQERVQNQVNFNTALHNELKSAHDKIDALSEKLRQRDAALKEFAGRGNRRDSDTESMSNHYDRGDARIKDDTARNDAALAVQKNEDHLVIRSSEPDSGEPATENDGSDPTIDLGEDSDVEFVDQDTKDMVDTLREGVNLRFCAELRVNGQGERTPLTETPGIASDDPRPIQGERNVTSGNMEAPATGVTSKGAMLSTRYMERMPPPPSSKWFNRESLVTRNGAAPLLPPSTLEPKKWAAAPELEYAHYLEARNKAQSDRLMLDANSRGNVEDFGKWRGTPMDVGTVGSVLVRDMKAFFKNESLDASEERIQPSIARGLGMSNVQPEIAGDDAAGTMLGRHEQFPKGAKKLSDLEKFMQLRNNGSSISEALEKSGAGRAIGGMAQARSQANRLDAQMRKNGLESADRPAISQEEGAASLLHVPGLSALASQVASDTNVDLQARLDALRHRPDLSGRDGQSPELPPSTTEARPSSNEKREVTNGTDQAANMQAKLLSDIKAVKLKPRERIWRGSLGQGWRDIKSAQ